MLVLTRKKNESIVIGNDVIVTICEVNAGKVRIGVEAPQQVKVHRKEVYDAITGKPTERSLYPKEAQR